MGIDFDDFFAAALLGLCDAARRYDPARGESFQTFSFLRIRGAMYDLIRRGGGRNGPIPWLNMESPVEEEDAPRTATVHFRNGERKSFVPANVNELAGTIATIEELNLRLWTQRETSRIELTYSDQEDPELAALQNNLRRFLSTMLVGLPPKERQIIELYYFQGWTFEEMREHFAGVSRSWLSRIHARAIKRLRAQIEIASRRCERKVHFHA